MLANLYTPRYTRHSGTCSPNTSGRYGFGEGLPLYSFDALIFGLKSNFFSLYSDLHFYNIRKFSMYLLTFYFLLSMPKFVTELPSFKEKGWFSN